MRLQPVVSGGASSTDALGDRANGIDVNAVEVRFPNGYYGLKQTSLNISAGTFCTLLGPSGSGKTTLLRAIAGLVTPSAGTISIGSREVTSLSVQARNIGFVFQNYALFPHMTVAQNIEYPLKLHKWSQVERRVRTKEILELIELPHVAERAVGELSGGQQQRVAIGRALAYRPSLLLLDEPMGALDRRLRQQLGSDLREIQQRTGITTVYVTHDQEEAFILSDKIAIMDGGEILQYDTPAELYLRPNSRFVARFLGEANIIPIDNLNHTSAGAVLAMTALGEIPLAAGSRGEVTGEPRSIVLRPEDLFFVKAETRNDDWSPTISVRIEKELFLGSRCLVTVSNQAGNTLLVECNKSEVAPCGADAWVTWKRTSAVLINR
ncbi:ABC transporter ATP-binding protein [Sinorhizobium meliloti]|uniref:ABC transporter ATP-binding protein n=1 Tax=Rhizobium meliloti TaxID=382 RepID=UPI000FD1A9BA|nr:ABC transporter ATP-binding protein [Sinorhizobium meliloti]MQV35239.1 ATP-binding cassette domain-containing protein [Sinorhizobium meliloti]RVM02710.1 ABC transporter ATP-binding protein [Sinorhizobium meliloti]RVM40415.1 ABC transporter ATP-binding protein [Sinorhizobium meliloti]RVM56227.1 ABC transporter ATP-binding protein [Sinorhizobium meliloti]RVM60316.1 ABC transporter ATP-binding protein [Sinorhizobium meliloti]